MARGTPQAATRTVNGREVPAQGTWIVDPNHTTVTFEVRHMMISKARGTFGSTNGTIIVADDPLQSNVEVTIDIESVESGARDRDEYLLSHDFLDAENYPEMTFRSTSVETSGDGYRMMGELTIKDITRPIVMEFDFTGGLTDATGNARTGFRASLQTDREDWGLSWNMALEAGGVLVGKKIKVVIDAQAVRASK